MVSLGNFDAMAPENRQNQLVPKGEYRACLVAAEQKATKDGLGKYLNCEFKILSGEFQNRSVFLRMNLWLEPSKEKAITIARGQLSELCRSVNVLTPKDTSELMNKPVIIKVKIVEDSTYGDKNEITGFKPAQINTVTPQQTPQPQAAAAGNVW